MAQPYGELQEHKFAMPDESITSTEVVLTSDRLDACIDRIVACLQRDVQGDFFRTDMIVGITLEKNHEVFDAKNTAVLAMCVPNFCGLIILRPGISYEHRHWGKLLRFLGNKDITFAAAYLLEDDVKYLRTVFGISIPNAVDVRKWAANDSRQPMLRALSVQGVARKLVKGRSPFTQRVPDLFLKPWSSNLSEEQIRGIALDAYAALRIVGYLLDTKCWL